MKLVTRGMQLNDLIALRDMLEANGIPAVIQDDNTARMITPVTTMGQGLWIYIDSQESEAKALLENPDHVVANPVDIKAFYEVSRNITDDRSFVNMAMIRLGLLLGMFLIALFLMILLLHWLAT
ncbi:MAG: hypothetical protein PVJ14_00660 [Chromatiales bacterium]